MEKIKAVKKARIGIYTMGLKAYWNQFAGLHDRLIEYGKFIEKKVSEMDVEVYNYGLVDCECIFRIISAAVPAGRRAIPFETA